MRAIDAMATIHATVEAKRKVNIPDWAYRDVLFMLIDYSIRSFEVLERTLTEAEKNEVFLVFNQVGTRMGVPGLPQTFKGWQKMRQEHLDQHLQHSHYTNDLFSQYRKHLGVVRYRVMLEAQRLVVPARVSVLLGFKRTSFLYPLLALYKVCWSIKIEWVLKELILPGKYKKEIGALHGVSG